VEKISTMASISSVADILLTVLKNGFFLYCSSVIVLPILSVFQERRIWQSNLLPSISILGLLKVFLFNVLWMGVTLVGGFALLPKFIVGKFLGFDCQYEAHLVERTTAKICSLCFICPKVEIRGEEHLPPDDGSAPAPIYVANHASQVDLAVVYFLGRRFKWISKDSVRYLPGVGLIMTLSQHVFIVRTGKNKRSVSNLYQQSNNAIQSGLPMFFFPQGTRRMAGRLPFKDGAYRVALENESQLVPVSIHIPLSCWNSWYPLCLLWGGSVENVVLTVHKPIQTKEGMDKEELKKKTYDAIFSEVPLIGEEVNEFKKKK
jgi:1-acyl-sn-glycerol-3-phosphate acyltransferase